jgi:uncharacterized Fe-S radical SAM superfamily protein PflX
MANQNLNNCELCGGDVDVNYYVGGPCRYLCDHCKEIIHTWEEKKERHRKLTKELGRRMHD